MNSPVSTTKETAKNDLPLKIGIISAKEVFTSRLLRELNAVPGIHAEWCRITEPFHSETNRYCVILDRLSHCLEYYQGYLKHACLTGTYVVNNPFIFLGDDKFFEYSLAHRLGIAVPKTILLPSREYDERILTPDDLHNIHRTPWEELIARLGGFPIIMKPYDGYGWREVYRINNLDELKSIYEESLMDVMMLQEYINFEHYVRCFVIGCKDVLPIHYRPQERRYILDHAHLTPELGEKIVQDSLKLCSVLGYDINTVEFAIKDGIPYAIDFMNPIPEAKPEVITEHYFEWLVTKVRDMLVSYAFQGKKNQDRYPSWFKATLNP